MPKCTRCGNAVPKKRAALGIRLCLPCGDASAKQERRLWTTAPLSKSNYVLITDPRDLKGLNPKNPK